MMNGLPEDSVWPPALSFLRLLISRRPFLRNRTFILLLFIYFFFGGASYSFGYAKITRARSAL